MNILRRKTSFSSSLFISFMTLIYFFNVYTTVSSFELTNFKPQNCLCNPSGSLNTCETKCQCKSNVIGTYCDQCKPGTYNLDAHNPDGCSQCFCFRNFTNNLNLNCKSSNWSVTIITSDFKSKNEWKVVDLSKFEYNLHLLLSNYYKNPSDQYFNYGVQEATIDLSNIVFGSNTQVKEDIFNISNKKDYLSIYGELPGKNTFYWLAPDFYLGNKLYAYGNELQIKLAYSILRGDKSGKFIHNKLNPDVIMIGVVNNTLFHIGYKWTNYVQNFHPEKNITIRISLREHVWHRLDNSAKLKINSPKITRAEFSLILNSLCMLLIRAKYHTDQIESRLYVATMGIAIDNRKEPYAKGTEQCECDKNETGLSCETCRPGFRRISKVKNHPNEVTCIPCDCNNNARNCDLKCECENYTNGTFCELCQTGYYGNALLPGGCKKCNCPLNCSCTNLINDFKCDSCPFGYTGKKCEYCQVGFYGDPKNGVGCRKCICSQLNIYLPGNCDNFTGKCRCTNNTIGDHCEDCAIGFYKKIVENYDSYGNKIKFLVCELCKCSIKGSINFTHCSSLTGQCKCKPNFDGFKCNQCAVGYENYEAGCPSCDCEKNNGTAPCINILLNDIYELKNSSQNYSFLALKSWPVVKLNRLKDNSDQNVKKMNRIQQIDYEANQLINNINKQLPDIECLIENQEKKILSASDSSLIVTENASQISKKSDLINYKIINLYTDLDVIVQTIKAIQSVKLNDEECEKLLNQSIKMLDEVKNFESNFKFKEILEKELNESMNLYHEVKNHFNVSSILEPGTELFDRFIRLTKVFSDAFDNVEKQITIPAIEHKEILERSNVLYETILQIIANVSLNMIESQEKLNTSNIMLHRAKENLTEISKIYEVFPREFNNLNTNTIEKLKNTLIRLNPQNEEKYAQICENHANDLITKAKDLKIKFQYAEDFAKEIDKKVKTNSYSQITDTISNIWLMLSENEDKVEELFSQIYSEKDNDEQAENRNKKSKELAEKVQKLNDTFLEEIRKRLEQNGHDIEKIQNHMFITDKLNGNLKVRNTILISIKNVLNDLANKSKTFKKIDERLPDTKRVLDKHNILIAKINHTITNEYLPALENLKSRKSLLDGNFVGEIDKIQKNIENKSKYVKSFELRNRKMDLMHRQMQKNLNEIVSKILLARQKASNIKISIRNNLDSNQNSSDSNLFTTNLPLINVTLLPPSSLINNVTSSLSFESKNQNYSEMNNYKFLAKRPSLGCRRSYASEFEASSVSTISLTFTVTERDQEDSLFLYVGSNQKTNSDKYDDFYVIELVNRKIRFITNIGSGIQVLEHPLTIESNNAQFTNKETWYKVQVYKLSNKILLHVNPFLSQTSNQEINFVSNETFRNYLQMDFNEETQILVGSMPDAWIFPDKKEIDEKEYELYSNAPKEIKSRHLSGCLFELNIDGQNIGLWNFIETSNLCLGCKEGISEEKPSNVFHFKNEFSYTMLPQINRYSNLKFSIHLYIRTFEEDALLFLTFNNLNGDSIVISLVNGKIRFQIFQNRTRLGFVLETKQKYNSGQWIYISAERDNLEGFLRVDNEIIEKSVSYLNDTSLFSQNNDELIQTINPILSKDSSTTLSLNAASNLIYSNSILNSQPFSIPILHLRHLKLDLADQQLFIGGVPLNFSFNSSLKLNLKSFIGCMKDIQIDTTPLNLMNQIGYGIDNGCIEHPVSHKIKFYGDSYIESNSELLSNNSQFSFTFKTLQNNTFILVSKFDNSEIINEPYLANHSYSLVIKDGYLQVKIMATSMLVKNKVSKILLQSNKIVNDGEYHSVLVLKKQRKITLYVDDTLCDALHLLRGVFTVLAPSNGGLFIGGYPDDSNQLIRSKSTFIGTIKDIVFNNKLLELNKKHFT